MGDSIRNAAQRGAIGMLHGKKSLVVSREERCDGVAGVARGET
ncbi:hypothetical protein RSSM_03389 [Rhodopirellula sallentina SM41]|uniref:Uncharacterized protein n=1 Tax=Rhodopirellula sallentina SM41 TaxID=1263870 RepID=M5U1N3_9BACT|nr:hypothetical protein RSSM_03389 [Rhodopirellula sallentina SM41]